MKDVLEQAKDSLNSYEYAHAYGCDPMYPASLIRSLVAEVTLLREYAGPGPYEPSEADGAKAPTWQELRALADHNFQLYANASAENERLIKLYQSMSDDYERKYEGFG